MAEEKELTGWERSRAAQKGYGNFYAGLAIAIVFIAGVWIGSRVFATPEDPDSTGFFLNLWTEALGILVTVGLFGLISKYLADERYKQQLVDEAASTSNEIAKHAVHVMRRKGWLEGENGQLRHQHLYSACLQNANLTRANLKGATLNYADLENARLYSANLEEANLSNACLRGAKLINANLNKSILNKVDLSNSDLSNAKLQSTSVLDANLEQANMSSARLERTNLDFCNLKNANLDYADLRNASLGKADLLNANLENADVQNAVLNGANLRGANFSDANLRGTNFKLSKCDETTILPNGSNWSKDSDWDRYTDPNDSKFWRSANPDSPAYYENT